MRSKILNAIQEGIKQSFMIDSEINDEDYVKSKISKTENFVPYEYRFVDLGLSVLWADYNIGAYPGNKSKDWHGDYYAWGETEPKQKYDWDNYKFYKWDKHKFEEILTKYNKTDNLKQLQPEDDIVTLKLGDTFRMPTNAEFAELCDTSKVTNTWISDYKGISGLNGRLFVSKISGFEGNSIFIPAAGSLYGPDHLNISSYGSVLTSSFNSEHPFGAYIINFCSNKIEHNYYDARCRGFSIRAVQDKK